jgi:hypothetical protein
MTPELGYRRTSQVELFLDGLRSQTNALRRQLEEKQMFLCEYLNGAETIAITNVGMVSENTIGLTGFDRNDSPCFVISNVNVISLLFRVIEKDKQPKRSYGFAVDISSHNP